VDTAITRLMEAGQIPGAIVVGMWSTNQRWREYMPQNLLEIPQGEHLRRPFIAQNGGLPLSNAYLQFLVSELKPFIDANYPTLQDRGSAFIMGSSMGGLVSLYAIEEYPQVFGGAGCLSTHWPAGGDALVDFLGNHLPTPGSHRLYFDFGTQTLDAAYELFQLQMDQKLEQAGYRAGMDWITRKFPGADHSEAAWRQRVDLPLLFLLTGEAPSK
jgi:enterochelin esterase-like enzyme